VHGALAGIKIERDLLTRIAQFCVELKVTGNAVNSIMRAPPRWQHMRVKNKSMMKT
jgi:hypothetical protein